MNFNPEILLWFIPLIWVALWIGITTFIGRLSGWHKLQERFPDKDEDPSVSMRMQSGLMRTTRLKGCLTIEICPTGLRLKIWKIFGVFAKPIFVPWGMIKAENESGLFGRGLKMTFGHDQIGFLKVFGSTAENILERSPLEKIVPRD